MIDRFPASRSFTRSPRLLILAALLLSARPSFAGTINFSRDVEPILKAHCYDCHNFQKMGGLRLDDKVSAFEGGASGKVILPGNGKGSLLVQRILGAGGKPRMPLGLPALAPSEIAAIQAWIDRGAVWNSPTTRFWTFAPPRRPPLPTVRLSSWPRNGIDRFILAKLEKDGLHPSPPASRAILIRRVSLDLTGTPPSPEEVNAFVSDRSPNAYEKVVDRLLASPRYGERMAIDWMDGARYADSNGYQSDWERYQWRWRDWVINAFNANMPFDEFTIEQLAGDLLPHPTLNQVIATGFNRNHRINTEGGVIPEEWRVENVIDRASTTAQVWLGLTMGCARCHDHKYDPISQKEFYQFCAYFNNVPESGTGVEQPVNHPPLISAPTPDEVQRVHGYETTLKALDGWIDRRLTANLNQSRSWRLSGSDTAPPSDGLVARYALSATPIVSSGAAPVPRISGAVKGDAGKATGAVVLRDGSYVDLGNVGDFERDQPFSYGAWVNPENGDGSPLSRMDAGNDFRGWDLFLAGGRPAVHIIHKWPMDALKVIGKTPLANGEWTHVFVTYDGSGTPEGIKLYLNGKRTDFDVEVNALKGTIRTSVTARIGTRTGGSPFTGRVDDAAIFRRALTPDEVARLANNDPAKALLAIPVEQRTSDQERQIARLWSDRNDPAFHVVSQERATTAANREKLENSIPTVMVMQEMPQPRDCFVLIRGEYDKHGEKVSSGIPAIFGPLPPGAPRNRLGLAEWIASPTNPLTARVAVNRLWEKFFGAGIIRTTEDMGTRSEPASHRELLDWLATEFVRLHWDLKAIQKEIVMSATYEQSSAVSPLLLHRDPENRLLARGPRFRLPGEVIRDQALAAAGLLTEKIGGPSVRPYQPDGIWDETSVYGNLHNYKHDPAPNLYRRSLYTIWKRTAAPPEMTLFDVPSREVCQVRRSRTNTPLQALVLLDDETFVEAARVLAQKAILEGGPTAAQRIKYAFRRVLARAPTPAEERILERGLDRRLQLYRSRPDDASRLIQIGDAQRDSRIPAPELAAYTITASVILNMDEAVTKG